MSYGPARAAAEKPIDGRAAPRAGHGSAAVSQLAIAGSAAGRATSRAVTGRAISRAVTAGQTISRAVTGRAISRAVAGLHVSINDRHSRAD